MPDAEGFTDPDTSGRDGRTEFPPHPAALAAVPRGRRGTAPWPRPVTTSRLTTPVRERGWRTRRAFGSSSPDPNLAGVASFVTVVMWAKRGPAEDSFRLSSRTLAGFMSAWPPAWRRELVTLPRQHGAGAHLRSVSS